MRLPGETRVALFSSKRDDFDPAPGYFCLNPQIFFSLWLFTVFTTSSVTSLVAPCDSLRAECGFKIVSSQSDLYRIGTNPAFSISF